jgi:hypothetical protein
MCDTLLAIAGVAATARLSAAQAGVEASWCADWAVLPGRHALLLCSCTLLCHPKL